MGGGNNPMNFAKSKAKFQMEPNTGITFDDVAGVNEAKEDFMEVGSHFSQSMHANTTHIRVPITVHEWKNRFHNHGPLLIRVQLGY